MKFTLKPAIARCVATLFCAALAWPFSAVAQKSPPVKVLDRIVAVVNDEVITRNELDERVKLAFRQLRQQGTPAPARETLERQLLERMVTDRVQLQFAKETGLRVDDVELDRAIARIAQENKLTSQQLRQVLEKDGIPFAKFRDDIRNEIVITRLREREVDTKIVVTDGEIDNFLSLQHQSDANEEYNVSHILVVVPENASPEQIAARRTRADEAYAQLKGGADFRQVAVAFSEAPDALQGGAMGWRQSSRLPTLFTEALRPLKPGELSAILRSANGFHILKLNDKRSGGAPVIVQQTHARHILVKTNELVSESEARSRLLALKERLENKADFAALARAHSEDPSATRGGDLGWLSPGDTVPEFERAMNALKPGEISGPVQTPFGWHLIQVIERRNEDLSKERQRLAARQTLRARKSDEAYQEWVRQLRDRAYIDLRTDER
jgi:peptidyl-prolyl cis-trans isomerase SurA